MTITTPTPTPFQTVHRADSTETLAGFHHGYVCDEMRNALAVMSDADYSRVLGLYGHHAYGRYTPAESHVLVTAHYGLPAGWRDVPAFDVCGTYRTVTHSREAAEPVFATLSPENRETLVRFMDLDLYRPGFGEWLEAMTADAPEGTVYSHQQWPSVTRILYREGESRPWHVHTVTTRGVRVERYHELARLVADYFGSLRPEIVALLEEHEPDAITSCDDCGDVLLEENVTHTENDETLCSSCVSECEHCNEYVRRSDLENVEGESGYSISVCSACVSDHVVSCDDCGRSIMYDNGTRCNSCAAQRNVIRGYHSGKGQRPCISDKWTRSHNGRHFGVELELECVNGSDKDDIAAEIAAVANRDRTVMHFENDGSLSYGFECITFPLSLPAQRELWARVLSVSELRDCRSHDATTCGIHIHVSRRSLSKLTIAKVSAFLCNPNNRTFVKAIARRYGSAHCNPHTRKLANAGDSHDRYEFVNTTNRDTVEFRIFRGSLAVQTVSASVEFVHMLCNWAETVSMAEMSPASLVAFVYRMENASETRFLRAYMEKRSRSYSELAAFITAGKEASKRHNTGTRAPRFSHANMEGE